jgi:hypothetical protein
MKNRDTSRFKSELSTQTYTHLIITEIAIFYLTDSLLVKIPIYASRSKLKE